MGTMAGTGPGRYCREGLTATELLEMFPDDAAAEKWFEEQRWPEGRFCPRCGSLDTYAVANRRPMPYHCRDCREYFSVRFGTTMQSSKLGFRTWVVATCMMATGPEGISSMKIHRELGIRQSTAWHLMQRIQRGFEDSTGIPLPRWVETDETCVSGSEGNNYPRKKLKAGRKAVPKTAVPGVKDRATNDVGGQVVENNAAEILQGYTTERAGDDKKVSTERALAYISIDRDHETVNHLAGKYVIDEAQTQGTDSFWAILKGGHDGVCHKFRERYPYRHVQEFAVRQSIRDLDNSVQVTVLARDMVARCLRNRNLLADNWLVSGAIS